MTEHDPLDIFDHLERHPDATNLPARIMDEPYEDHDDDEDERAGHSMYDRWY
jgi:hypothetical protein